VRDRAVWRARVAALMPLLAWRELTMIPFWKAKSANLMCKGQICVQQSTG